MYMYMHVLHILHCACCALRGHQGMDSMNERRVFDLVVAATSQGTDSSQYFILTPKVYLKAGIIRATLI